MTKLLIGGMAAVAILLSAVAGYKFATFGDMQGHAPTSQDQARSVLYWKHPTDETDFSASPKKTPDGRDYVPVYSDQEADFAGGREAPQSGNRRILYYRNPMGLPDTSPTPKKDSMGMDYIPVYEGEDDDQGTVKISPARIQRSGVRSERAAQQRVSRPIRAPGIAKPDERTLHSVTLRADSFIEELYINEDGRHVEAGEPLFRIYSPDMVKVQVDYRISRSAGAARNELGSVQRLKNLELPPKVIEDLQRTGEPVLSFDWPSPASGFILKKNVVQGAMAKVGDELFRIADLSTVWIIADVAEQDISRVRIGDKAKVSFRAIPGETFESEVTFIFHELDPETRTGKVRLELANPSHRIKHEMFADVEIEESHNEPMLAVPLSALLDNGSRQVVLVDLGDGRFEPREVKTGLRGEQYVAILAGVKEGENVVISANFLIDAESNLKAALSSFSDPAGGASAITKPTPSHDHSQMPEKTQP